MKRDNWELLTYFFAISLLVGPLFFFFLFSFNTKQLIEIMKRNKRSRDLITIINAYCRKRVKGGELGKLKYDSLRMGISFLAFCIGLGIWRDGSSQILCWQKTCLLVNNKRVLSPSSWFNSDDGFLLYMFPLAMLFVVHSCLTFRNLI